ncbi:MAG TPA: hypothetical protein VFV37_02930, partial [Luteibaculaceae bacterium]|nr:hypothetical protein [Luteibaculaceae bacterium]
MKTVNKWYALAISTLLYVCLSLIAVNQHRNVNVDDYHSELWADRSGYYVYLPMWFNYGMKSDDFPEEAFDPGCGYSKDSISGLVYTKYPSGVALLAAPFYVTWQWVKPASDQYLTQADLRWANFVGCFYAVLGLFLLYVFLIQHFTRWISFAVIATIFLSTSLLYYTIIEAFMAHIYGFFLVSALLLFLETRLAKNNFTWLHAVVFGLICGLLVLCRATNVIFLVGILAWFIYRSGQGSQLLQLNKWPWKALITATIAFLACWIPQFYYWFSLRGSIFIDAYQGEHFDFLHPELLLHYFSPYNGFFLYMPLAALLLVYALIRIRKYPEFRFFLPTIALAGFVFASWTSWGFGCSFGQRSYIEVYPIFAFILGRAITEWFSRSWFTRAITTSVLILFSWNSFSLSTHYDACFYGQRWDWQEYFLLCNKSHSWVFKVNAWTMKDDFEGEPFHFEVGRENLISNNEAYSGDTVCQILPTTLYGPGAATQLRWLTGSDTLQQLDY